MTTVLTRLFKSENLARGVADRLRWEGVPNRAMRVIAPVEGEAAGDLTERLAAAGVHESTVGAYASQMTDGNAVLVVKATHKPLGAARIARETLRVNKPLDAGEVVEEYKTATEFNHAPSILEDNPFMMTSRIDVKRIMDSGPIFQSLAPRIPRPRQANSAMRGGRFMSRMFWPMPLLSRNRTANSAMKGGGHMSKMFWPMKLVSTKNRRLAVMAGGGQPVSRAMGFPQVINHK